MSLGVRRDPVPQGTGLKVREQGLSHEPDGLRVLEWLITHYVRTRYNYFYYGIDRILHAWKRLPKSSANANTHFIF